jgi:hypothetical protein
MKTMKTWARCTASIALLLSGAAAAGDPPSCSAPGVQVMQDPAGDEQGAPATSFADILSLSIAEPPSSDGVDRLVFTYKMSDLATVPPNGLWAIRFNTDVPPPNGDDTYFVAMVADPSATVHFMYGTQALEQGTAPRLWTPAGDLDAASHYDADGTITLVLDKSKIPGAVTGGFLSGFTTQAMIDHSPTEGSIPFTTGLVALLLDAGDPADDYAIAGSSNCSAKSGLLGLGALPLPGLLVLLALGALRRAARR